MASEQFTRQKDREKERLYKFNFKFNMVFIRRNVHERHRPSV